MRWITASLVLLFSALILASMSVNAEEPTYENPELDIKFNLKDDYEKLTPQNKLPGEPETKKTIQAQYTTYPFDLTRSESEPVKVGTWTSDAVEFDISITVNSADIWWEVIPEGDYEPDCEWTFYIQHNGNNIGDTTEPCQSQGEDLSKETYNVGITVDLIAGDTFGLELWVESWEDLNMYHDNITYDTGINVKGTHLFFFDGMWKGSEVSLEFVEAWPTNWDTNLDGGFIMLMGEDDYMADNNKAETMEGNEYTIKMTNGSVDVTSLIIKWTEVTGSGLTLMMDYTTFDHMPSNGSANSTGKKAIVMVNLVKAKQLLGDEGGLLGLPGFEIALAIGTVGTVAFYRKKIN